MQNIIPVSHPELLTFAGAAAIGAGQYGAAIPLLQNTKTKIDTDVQTLVDAIMEYGTGRTELKTRSKTVKDLALDCRILLMLGRDSLKPQLGNFFNELWLALGHNGSLEITEDTTQLLNLLRSYKEFLQNHADLELPTKDFTAVHLEALFTELENAIGAVNIQETVAGDLLSDRNTKAEKLRKRVRGLIEELNQNIDPLDQRWKAFGFNRPGAQETPDQVEHVQVTLIGPTAAAVKWPATARAEYFRIWTKVVGVDTEPKAVGSPADLDFTIEQLPTNSQVEVYVTAVNNGGESPLSEKITIVTHA